MKAKRVKDFIKKAVVFDFDDTLVKTDAKTHVYRDGKKIKSLSPSEFNSYVLKSGETLDFNDFKDPLIVLNAKKYKMWGALESLYFKIQNGQENTDIYILTARDKSISGSIWTFLKRNGIILPDENIIAIGGDDNFDIAKKKKNVLEKLKNKYSSILFYDDSRENIKIAGEIGGINTILVDDLNEFLKSGDVKSGLNIGIRTKIKAWLDEMGVENYIIKEDFFIDCDKNVDLSYKDLTEFPPFIKFGIVRGTFDISNNKLNNLEGSPIEVGGNFWCSKNNLETLIGSPKKIGANFYCSFNKLKSLIGSPEKISRGFFCHLNELITLDGAPQVVGGDFDCSSNPKRFTKPEVIEVCKVKGRITT